MFFDNWFGLLRTIVVGFLAYCALVLFLRVSGKRTLAKMSAFDLVVTVALGSTLATVLLTKDVALLEGLLAFVVLITLQFLIAWLNTHSPRFQTMVKSEPRLLLHKGQPLHAAMRAERVTLEEIDAAVRQEGIASLKSVEAVVLETDGSFSVVTQQSGQDVSDEETSLRSVRRSDV